IKSTHSFIIMILYHVKEEIIMLILGSQSPRRKELLESAGLIFNTVKPLFDEDSLPYEGDPSEYVKELAKAKAHSLVSTYPKDVILTADTIVVVDHEILGKPKDEEDAFRMLSLLNDKMHTVYTAVCIKYMDKEEVFLEEADVEFNKMSELDIRSYIQTGESLDKAGAYAIQGIGSKFIKHYEGDFHTIMGLPLKALLTRLKN